MNRITLTLLLILALLAAACAPATPTGTPPAPAGNAAAPAGSAPVPGGGAPASGPGPAAQAGPGGAAGGGGFGGGNRRSAVIAVQVQNARQGQLSVDNTAAGAIAPDTQSSVAAGSTGTVKAVLRQAGDWVEAGTPVLQLDDAQLKLSVRLAQAALDTARLNAGVGPSGTVDSNDTSKLNLQLKSAQSALSAAEKNWASAQALNKIQGISGSDYDNAQVQLQTAQANLEAARMGLQQGSLQVETASIQLQQAQLNLANATIRSPYAGQISVINVHPGEYVGPSTAVFGLVSRTKVISFSVAPTDAPGLTIGKPVRFTYQGKTAMTKVTQTPSAPVNGLVTLTAALPAELTANFGTVGTVAYSVVLAEGTIIPLPALQSAENKTFVYTVGANNKAARVEVGILAESGSFAAVSGLAGNSVVILNPPPGLLVGATVQPVGAAAAGAGAAGSGAAPGQGQAQGQGQGQGQGQRQRPAVDGATATGSAPGATGAPGQGQRRRPAGESTGAANAPAAGTAP